MALTRKQKESLVDNYKVDIESSSNIVLLKQSGIPVNEINKLRNSIVEFGAKMVVVKKRVFLSTAISSGLGEVSLDDLEGSVIALFSSGENEYLPLKEVSKFVKQAKKEKKLFELVYLGGWYDSEWKDSSYVSEIAELPTKDELLSKFAFLMNYPLRSFAVGVDQIAKKGE
ncbi:50S ribosomal protein L10 [Candidatus Vampirococcus lugosii]|uniref:Large ribosomal subunit protein uL10 n=1 Tax=Candidatus Vampirococcus lugosii TaxID=2789015 RepID=A0ABS5QKP2_9BACT|nr:50S ribosomal protein L10 [Candidatus Vampirococcus lugosii]MBS8121800.1 50S ribosomal protein L10 [Candidatus Vampirococcus lugosii]